MKKTMLTLAVLLTLTMQSYAYDYVTLGVETTMSADGKQWLMTKLAQFLDDGTTASISVSGLPRWTKDAKVMRTLTITVDSLRNKKYALTKQKVQNAVNAHMSAGDKAALHLWKGRRAAVAAEGWVLDEVEP